ncbi:amidohydrolase family protein [Gordonibacter sp.]|uniref:amidohydrolase family protein n=1 Tax=Gordonibacter sp. TaxID=1968902 RepID=UPI002FC7BA92
MSDPIPENDRPEETRVSRRLFVKMGAVGVAVGAASLAFGCSPAADGSNAMGKPDKESLKGDCSSVPVDNAGNEVKEASSVADATNVAVDIEKPNVELTYDIVDSHLHYTDFLERTDGFPSLVKAMDAAGVSQSVIFGMGIVKQWDESLDKAPQYYLSNDSRCYYYSATDFIVAEDLLAQPEATRKRFFPFACGINGNDRFSADHLRRLLKLYPNFWCGIGELMSRHDDLTALTYGEPPHIDHPAFLEIFDLAAQESLPVLVHHNITAQNSEEILYLSELEEALAHNRDCKIIWAHVGISRRVEIQNLPRIADDLLANNENLWIDISWVVYDYYFLDKFPNQYHDGNTLDDWVALIEKYPDRFMLGTDKVGHWATYPAETVKYYPLLDKLSPVAARKLCRDNILAVIKTYE